MRRVTVATDARLTVRALYGLPAHGTKGSGYIVTRKGAVTVNERQINEPMRGKTRVCVVSECGRAGINAVCWWHRMHQMEQVPDPFELLACGALDARERALDRLAKLREAERTGYGRGPRGRRVHRTLQNEIDELSARIRPVIIDELVQKWRQTSEQPTWRLPPERWLEEQFENYPDVRLDRTLRSGSEVGALDHEARSRFDDAHPPGIPFLGVLEVRRGVNQKDFDELTVQSDRNTGLGERAHAPLAKYVGAIAAWTDHSDGNLLAKVFADSAVDSFVPPGVVVHHLLGMRAEAGSGVAATSTWAVRRHRELEPDDIVQYHHARGATLKSHWFGSLGIGAQPWITDTAPRPQAIRLELAPLRGLFVGGMSRDEWPEISRPELELILPAGSIWRVVAHRDVVIDDARMDATPKLGRVHTIQMVEISEVPAGAKVIDLTRPIRETTY